MAYWIVSTVYLLLVIFVGINQLSPLETVRGMGPPATARATAALHRMFVTLSVVCMIGTAYCCFRAAKGWADSSLTDTPSAPVTSVPGADLFSSVN